jgi:hypothetical protein
VIVSPPSSHALEASPSTSHSTVRSFQPSSLCAAKSRCVAPAGRAVSRSSVGAAAAQALAPGARAGPSTLPTASRQCASIATWLGFGFGFGSGLGLGLGLGLGFQR